MKKLLLILCLITSSFLYAQSNLPLCNGNFVGPCFGSYTFPQGDKFAGSKYVGEIKDFKWNGQGTYTSADGWKYVGQYRGGEKNGQGTYTFADGKKYVGQWKDDNYDGFGTFYYANGSIYQQGLWKNDKFVQAQSPPVVPIPPANNAQDIKRQKCIRLGLAPGSADFQQCMK